MLQDRATVVIPQEYASLPPGENFLLYDSGVGDENRILVFGTKRSMALLQAAENVYMDGTFKIVPELYCQLYKIHASTNAGCMVPCVYALMPNKTRESYNCLFEAMKHLTPDL